MATASSKPFLWFDVVRRCLDPLGLWADGDAAWQAACEEVAEARRQGLRDQFAAAALTGLLADGCDRCDMTQVCDLAYLWADVMVLQGGKND